MEFGVFWAGEARPNTPNPFIEMLLITQPACQSCGYDVAVDVCDFPLTPRFTQAQEVLDPRAAQRQPEHGWKSLQAALPVNEFRLIQGIFLVLPKQGAAAVSQHVGAPIHFLAIGQRNDKAALCWLGNDGDAVELAALAPGVALDCKMTKAFPGNVNEQLVGHVLVHYSDTITDRLF
jgi:hypothetical protein